MFAVFVQSSEVMSVLLLLTPPNTTEKETTTGLDMPTMHECIDTRDGNYTCTGYLNGKYFQFNTHYTLRSIINSTPSSTPTTHCMCSILER